MVIYKIENNKNGMVYIGQTTKTVAERVKQHLQKKSKIGKAMVEEGKENFTISVLDHATNKQELDELERYWIAFFNARENGYNTLIGGTPTKEEFKLLNKMPKTQRKKKRKKVTEVFKSEKTEKTVKVTKKKAKVQEIPKYAPEWLKEQTEILKEYIYLFGDSEGIRMIFSTKLSVRQLNFFKGEIRAFKKAGFDKRWRRL